MTRLLRWLRGFYLWALDLGFSFGARPARGFCYPAVALSDEQRQALAEQMEEAKLQELERLRAVAFLRVARLTARVACDLPPLPATLPSLEAAREHWLKLEAASEPPEELGP